LWSSADRVADYLRVLLAVRYDIDIIDRIAKARKLDDFMEGIYNALRLRQNLEESIRDKIEIVKEEEYKKALEYAIKIIHNCNSSDIKNLKELTRD